MATVKLNQTALSLLATANKKQAKTVIVDAYREIIGRRHSELQNVLQDRAAKMLVKSGYFEVVFKGKYKSPMVRRMGHCDGTETKYKITRDGEKRARA